MYLVLELPPERLHIEGYRKILRKFIKVVQSADPREVIVQYEDNLEVLDKKVYTYMYESITGKDGVPESVI